jgi:cobalamin biosynthesis Mg chelatase CobN
VTTPYRKHSLELAGQGVERPSSRLFSNPAGDYGSMVNERVGTGRAACYTLLYIYYIMLNILEDIYTLF